MSPRILIAALEPERAAQALRDEQVASFVPPTRQPVERPTRQ
jgi:hypothetical protein